MRKRVLQLIPIHGDSHLPFYRRPSSRGRGIPVPSLSFGLARLARQRGLAVSWLTFFCLCATVSLAWARPIPLESRQPVNGRIELADGGELSFRFLGEEGRGGLRMSCDSPPLRYGLSGDLLLLGPWSHPTHLPDGTYSFDEATWPGALWAISPATCRISRTEPPNPARDLLRLEREAPSVHALRARLGPRLSLALEPAILSWLEAAPSDSLWLSRYLAVRPSPKGSGRSLHPVSKTRRVNLEKELRDPAPLLLSEDSAAYRVRGPAVVVLTARRLSRPGTAAADLCLEVLGEVVCQSALPELQLETRGGRLKLADVRYKGQTVSVAREFRFYLPPGVHPFRLTGSALLQGERHEPPGQAFLPFINETHGAIAPPPVDPQDRASSGGRAVLPGGVSPLVSWQRGSSSPSLEALLFPMTNLARVGVPVWISSLADAPNYTVLDDQGGLQLWLEDAETPCHVSFADGITFAGFGRDPLQSFRWVGGPRPSQERPTLKACRAWVRALPLMRDAPPLPGASVSTFVPLEAGSPLKYGLSPQLPAVLRLSLQADQREIIRLTLQGWRKGASLAETIDMFIIPAQLPKGPLVQARAGRPWRLPLVLPLPVGWQLLLVTADSPVMARLTQPAPESEPAASSLEPPPVNTKVTLEAFDDEWLRRASRAVALSPTAEARAAALVKRAHLLSTLLLKDAAARDALYALQMSPLTADLEAFEPMPPASSATIPVGRFIPVGASWLEVGQTPLPLADERVLLARSGDVSALAVRCGHLTPGEVCHSDAIRLWRSVLTSGGKVDAQERLMAFSDFLRLGAPDEREAVSSWPFRNGSRWEAVKRLSGSVQTSRAFSPATLRGLDVEDGLFPERWEESEQIRLEAGGPVRLKGTPLERWLPVRCRAVGPSLPQSDPVISLSSRRGERLAFTEVDPFGAASLLHVPASRDPFYVEVSASSPCRCQLRLSPEEVLEVTGKRYALVHRLPAGRIGQLEVVGPTAIRIDAPVGSPLEVVLRSNNSDRDETDQRAQLIVPRIGRLELPVSDEGPVMVGLRSDIGLELGVYVRVADGPREGSFQNDRQAFEPYLAR